MFIVYTYLYDEITVNIEPVSPIPPHERLSFDKFKNTRWRSLYQKLPKPLSRRDWTAFEEG